MEPMVLQYGFREAPEVTVERRSLYDDPTVWRIRVGNMFLNKNGQLESDPVGSDNLFDCLTDAICAAQVYIVSIHED